MYMYATDLHKHKQMNLHVCTMHQQY